jgi:hypothetical protein
MDPSACDPRSVQYRVYVQGGKLSEIEIFVQLRKADGTADTPVSVKCARPQA